MIGNNFHLLVINVACNDLGKPMEVDCQRCFGFIMKTGNISFLLDVHMRKT